VITDPDYERTRREGTQGCPTAFKVARTGRETPRQCSVEAQAALDAEHRRITTRRGGKREWNTQRTTTSPR
jgi:hypothetical protein